MRKLTLPLLPVLVIISAAAPLVAGQSSSGLSSVLRAVEFRNIGPFRTSAWITEMAVPEAPLRDHLYTIYAASRSGGLWKTINSGTTWNNISDSVDVGAVGAVALSPSNPDIVWMGTGANDLARSSYSGTGVYKSTDAGASFQLMGLADSHHIARIVVHPTDPDTVWVAAMGHLFSRNAERGVFRTRDGGATWENVLFVDDGTGAIDLVIDRDAPDTLFAAMYEKHRTRLAAGSRRSGHRVSTAAATAAPPGAGSKDCPTGDIGRIGLDLKSAERRCSMQWSRTSIRVRPAGRRSHATPATPIA